MTNAWPLPETGKHTELPWAATTRQGSWDWVVYSASKPHLEICQPFHDGTEDNPTGEANAALIVRAANAHEGNIAALKEAEEYFDQRADISSKNENAPNEEMRLLGIIRAALKQSEGTQVAPVAARVPTEVRRLVIAARIVAFENQSKEALKELDAASEAFADRVPWENQP